MKKRKLLLTLSLAGLMALASPALPAGAKWKTTNEGKMYTQEASPGYVTGLKKIGDYAYYFNESGIMQVGFQTISDKTYYFDEKTDTLGHLVYGWITTADGKRYYSNQNGVILQGKWLNNRYYFQDDGSLAVNAWVDGKWVGADGRYTGVVNNVGWVTDGGVTRYYDKTSHMLTGWQTISGQTYYFNPSSGNLLKGWFKVGNARYYGDTKTGAILKNTWKDSRYLKSDGAAAIGLYKIGGKTYLFKTSGKVQSGGWARYNGIYYYCTKKGVIETNKWLDSNTKYVTSTGARASGFTTIGSDTYYFNPTTGVKTTKWVTVGTDRYYLSKKTGILYKNHWVLSKKYYASSTGAVLKGLNEINGKLYYFDTTTGRKATNSLQTIGSDKYYFNSKGAALKDKWQEISGKYYYFQSDSKMAVNTWIGDYYVGLDGARTDRNKTVGWSTVDGVKYYYDSNGNMVTGWTTIDKNKYYFDSTGAMVTGIQTIGSKKYYFYSSGIMAHSITIAVGTKQYTLNSSGVVTDEVSMKVSENTVGGQIVNFALQYVGNPYVYGGTSLTKGADCSGFVQTVFSNFKIKLLRVADDQMKGPSSAYIQNGYKEAVVVDMSSLQPGDLLFYGSGNYASHVAIYMGNGQIVHASNSQPYPAGGIKVSNYDYQTPIRAVRYWS